jgi:hypothetical protein
MKLRNPRFINAKPEADLLHRQAIFIVESNDRAFAVRQTVKRAGKKFILLPFVTQGKRVLVPRGRQVFLIHAPDELLRYPRPGSLKADPPQFGYPHVPFVQGQPHRFGHFGIFGRAPQSALKGLAGGLHLLNPSPHVTRSIVLVAQRVQNRSANSVARVNLNGHAFGRVKLPDGIDQAHGPVADQVIQFDVRGKPSPHLQRHALDQRQQFHNKVVCTAPVVRRPAALRRVRTWR